MIRRACATLALLALMLQGSSGGHMLLVEHTKCAEHGELVHDGHAHRVDAPSRTDRSWQNHSTPQTEASHEHCSLATDRRHAVPAIVGAGMTGLLEIAATSRFDVEVASWGDFPRFRLAPKNSPPA